MANVASDSASVSNCPCIERWRGPEWPQILLFLCSASVAKAGDEREKEARWEMTARARASVAAGTVGVTVQGRGARTVERSVRFRPARPVRLGEWWAGRAGPR